MHINAIPFLVTDGGAGAGRCQEVIISMLRTLINSDPLWLFSNMPSWTSHRRLSSHALVGLLVPVIQHPKVNWCYSYRQIFTQRWYSNVSYTKSCRSFTANSMHLSLADLCQGLPLWICYLNFRIPKRLNFLDAAVLNRNLMA